MRATGQPRFLRKTVLLATLPLVVAILVPGAVADEGIPPSRSREATPSAERADQNDETVTICHRTRSRTNPYNQIVVAESAATNGHAELHTDPIFGPDVEDWGDIIPPIRPGLPHGLNWPEGEAILDNGCEMEPDAGPMPEAKIGDVTCLGTTASVAVTVTNGDDATQPALFRVFIDDSEVREVGPLEPGASETVTLSSELQALEDQTVTIEVRSGGEVIDSQVVTVDCAPALPLVEVEAELVCAGQVAQGKATVTNHGPDEVKVKVKIGGKTLRPALRVGPGATETGTVDLSQYEDQTITVRIRVDGVTIGKYTITPDCVPPQPVPAVSVAGQRCPPPSSTVTLSNNGDPASQVVFVIRVDGTIVQETAPLYGGDTTTIVGDLSRYEDQTVTVTLHANGELLGSRTIRVNCQQTSPGGGGGGAGGGGTGPQAPS